MQSLIIGIAGGSGSGRTTVVKKILSSFPGKEVAVISQDAYYRDNSHLSLEERRKINFDHPNAIEFELLVNHMKQLKSGKSIAEPTYDYVTSTRQEKTVTISPRHIILVEGILLFTDKLYRLDFSKLDEIIRQIDKIKA